MATNFPASLDALTNPSAGDSLASPSHSAQHANSNDAIEALQAKVGIDSSAVTTSLDYKLRFITGSQVDRLSEKWNEVDLAATGTINFDILTASIWRYNTAAMANFTLNFRGDGSTTLASLMGIGTTRTVVFANTNGATPYRPTVFQIDGVPVTPIWQGGTAPTAGNASATDVYTFTIVRPSTPATYIVFASQTQFK